MTEPSPTPAQPLPSPPADRTVLDPPRRQRIISLLTLGCSPPCRQDETPLTGSDTLSSWLPTRRPVRIPANADALADPPPWWTVR
jgi:hypothetical protein